MKSNEVFLLVKTIGVVDLIFIYIRTGWKHSFPVKSGLKYVSFA
jgi:hypothetical protein